MEHIGQATKIFGDFLNDKDEVNLINELCKLESEIREEIGTDSRESLWLRFFDGDTLATTINDIKHDLHNPNRNDLLEKMEIGVEEKSIQVYYS